MSKLYDSITALNAASRVKEAAEEEFRRILTEECSKLFSEGSWVFTAQNIASYWTIRPANAVLGVRRVRLRGSG